MNILFISIAWPEKGQRNLYTDLMDEFVSHGHRVIVVGTSELPGEKQVLTEEQGKSVLRVTTGRIRKASYMRKILSLLTLGPKMKSAIFTQLGNYHFDLILGATPPITLSWLYPKLKIKFKAPFYLMLKDIWPQGSVDLGVIRKYSPGWLYLRAHEIRLYKIADYIGCMSAKGKAYLEAKNRFVDPEKVEVCPNSIRPTIESAFPDPSDIRNKYSIPDDACVFLFSGNLGVGHGLHFLMEVIQELRDYKKAYFVIGGAGTQYKMLEKRFSESQPPNAFLYNWLPREDFEKILMTSDVGLILLYKYTSPQFPSRLLSYLDYFKPALCAINPETDMGEIVEEVQCGRYVLHGDKKAFTEAVKYFAEHPEERLKMGKNGRSLLLDKYTANHSYQIIVEHFTE
jgi:glycosyltransferase involved in cell wall biosynthesis